MTQRLAKFPATATMRDTDVHGGAWECILLAHARKGASRSREDSSQRSPATALRDATAAKPSSARGRLADSAAIPVAGHGQRAARTGDTKTGLQRASACELHGEKDIPEGRAQMFFLSAKCVFFSEPKLSKWTFRGRFHLIDLWQDQRHPAANPGLKASPESPFQGDWSRTAS